MTGKQIRCVLASLPARKPALKPVLKSSCARHRIPPHPRARSRYNRRAVGVSFPISDPLNHTIHTIPYPDHMLVLIHPRAPRVSSNVNTAHQGARMQTVILYLSTAVVFLGLDAVMLKTVMRPLFEQHISLFLRDDLNIAPAAIFYLFYVAGVLFFVSAPALAAGSAAQSLLPAALLGAMAYGTYEFTNFATLKGWHWTMVTTDVVWGAVLTAISAYAGVKITLALT